MEQGYEGEQKNTLKRVKGRKRNRNNGGKRKQQLYSPMCLARNNLFWSLASLFAIESHISVPDFHNELS